MNLIGKKIVRWGIIGCGNVTEVKSGPGFQKAAGSSLVAVMRRKSELAKSYAERHNVPKWYDNAADLISDRDVDAVYIATPPSSHKEYAFAVARAGKPVYIEKPMALTYAECREIVKAFEYANLPLFVAYYRRAQPRFLKIKSLLDDGQIGKICSVTLRFYQPVSHADKQRIRHWRIDPAISGGGYFHDLGCHMIDMLHYLVGAITTAKGCSINQNGLYKADDIVSATFTFDNGALGAAVWNFCAGEHLDSTEIIGSEGSIRYATFQETPILLNKRGTTQQFDFPSLDHVQQPLIQTIVDELLGKGKCPSTGATGAATSMVIDKILGKI